LLPADCAGRPCPLCGGPVDVFGDHAVSCKKSGFGDRHLGTQTFFCQVLTQSRVPHDREVDIAGNGRRPADILLKAWDGRRDLAVDLTIVHPNPFAGRPLRGSAATLIRNAGKVRSHVDGWGWTCPQWCSTHGGPRDQFMRRMSAGLVLARHSAPFTSCTLCCAQMAKKAFRKALCLCELPLRSPHTKCSP